MEFGNSKKIEVFLRGCATLILVLTACLVGFNHQTKTIFYIQRTATYRHLNSLVMMVYVDSAAAGYNILQICKCLCSSWSKSKFGDSNHILFAWVCFLLDQVAVYVTFATNSAGLQASLLALTGVESLQWMKFCNMFTRFCFQIGGALACGYGASLLMFLISSLSAFNLFSNYSPNYFLFLKRT